MQTAGIMHVCLRLHLTSHHQRQRRRLQVGSQTTALPSRWHAAGQTLLLYSLLLLLLLLKIGMLVQAEQTLLYWAQGCRLFLLYSLLLLRLLLRIGTLLQAE